MLSIISTLSLKSLTARKYSHINENACILEKHDYTFLTKPPHHITYIHQTAILYPRNRSSAYSKPTFFSFIFFPISGEPLERIKTE